MPRLARVLPQAESAVPAAHDTNPLCFASATAGTHWRLTPHCERALLWPPAGRSACCARPCAACPSLLTPTPWTWCLRMPTSSRSTSRWASTQHPSTGEVRQESSASGVLACASQLACVRVHCTSAAAAVNRCWGLTTSVYALVDFHVPCVWGYVGAAVHLCAEGGLRARKKAAGMLCFCTAAAAAATPLSCLATTVEHSC